MASRPFASVAVALDATVERMDLMQPLVDVSLAVTLTRPDAISLVPRATVDILNFICVAVSYHVYDRQKLFFKKSLISTNNCRRILIL